MYSTITSDILLGASLVVVLTHEARVMA